MTKETNLDLLEMPFEALAAYWLSLKKVFDLKKGKVDFETEAHNTPEPFIRHVLELVFSELEIAVVRKLFQVKQDEMLHQLAQKLHLMRLAIQAIAINENPRISLIRMNAQFASPPLNEEEVFGMAKAMNEALEDPASHRKILLEIDHKMSADRLMVKLIFYIIYARRSGKQALDIFFNELNSPYFAEGLGLCIDGFEVDFINRHLESIAKEIRRSVEKKAAMSIEMALCIRKKYSYEDIYTVAKSYLP